jgi:hypothetical protein
VTASPPLADLQAWLRWLLTEPRGVDEALKNPGQAPASQGRSLAEPMPRLLTAIEDAGSLNAAARLHIYAGGYFERLLATLEADFPAVRRLLGIRDFRRLAADYLLDHPSRSPFIEDAGQGLPRFAENHPMSQRHPFLSDLAMLDWLVLSSVYADRAPAFAAAGLAQIPEDAWPRARMAFDPTIKLFLAEWPVDKFWQDRFKPAESGAQRPERRRPRPLLIYRDGADTQVSAVGIEEWTALKSLSDGRTLGDTCQELETSWEDLDPNAVKSWFGGWIAAGFIADITW